MVFNDSQSQRLKFIRFFAVSLIFITHISQEYKLSFGQWTNTGVQMFLVSSGFIMGQETKVDWKKWVCRRLLRIVPSYYSILLITAIAYWLILHKNILDLQYLAHFTTFHFLVYPYYPFWGGHLWYITAIAICYAIFPFLLASKKLNNFNFLILYLVVVPSFLLILFYKTGMPFRLSGDIYCFIIGFVVANIYNENPPKYLNIFLVLLSLMVLVGEYILIQNEYWNISVLQTAVQLLWSWKKCLYGLSICLFLYLPIIDKLSNNVLVNLIDKYSYDIYLSHYNFILGPLSLLHISSYYSLNIFVAIICSLLCAMIIHKLAILIKIIIEKHLT